MSMAIRRSKEHLLYACHTGRQPDSQGDLREDGIQKNILLTLLRKCEG